ncbi:putative sugar O-methyltransferase [Shewanella intestini]|uniref:Sugar O-methyltransferase n=1 Tax=Shewanella intestini TaxID=2017544 RepID=A0ABS5HY52_9GAMM|nr:MULTISPECIES: putative sugar O-methyltransferase [Shewanella]MBR9726705.1 putative sugar O-methyltransferase [Shewanella intestini]MRG34729.1 putative sugar O-methyltransferase [Shewanella sp. XMDDZSB0408]
MLSHQIATISEDMKQVDSKYLPTNFWQFGAKGLQQDLATHGIENFRRLPSALSYFVPTYRFNGWINQTEKYQTLLDSCLAHMQQDNKAALSINDSLSGEMHARSDYRVFKASESLKAPFTDKFTESDIGSPIEHFEFEGNKFSRSSLNYLLGLNFLKQQLHNVPVNTVLEIGGGFGTLGEILLSDPRNNSFYMNVDIAPTCLFSTYYLQTRFGQQHIADYQTVKSMSDKSLKQLSSQFNGAVLCPWQLPEVTGELDLFVNFISFQEMEPDIVANYLEHVTRLNCKYVLLRNLREGKKLAIDDSHLGVKKQIKAEDYDAFLTAYDLLSTNVHPFGFETIDGFHSELRLYQRKDLN